MTDAYGQLSEIQWIFSRNINFAGSTFFISKVAAITPFEIAFLGIIFLVVIVKSLSAGETEAKGKVVQFVVFFTMLLGLRKNVMQLLFGMSFERAILIHKSFGILAVICMLIHGAPALPERAGGTGVPLMILLLLQPLIYITVKVKLTFYEIFRFVHLVSVFIIIIVGAIHGASLLLALIPLWVLDIMGKYGWSLTHIPCAQMTIVGKQYIRVTFETTWANSIRPGSFLFVMIPSLGIFEWHPFSVAAIAHANAADINNDNNNNNDGNDNKNDDDNNDNMQRSLVTMVISVISPTPSWTSKLRDMVRHSFIDDHHIPDKAWMKDFKKQALNASGTYIETDIYVEGPYGHPSIDYKKYSIVVLLSGGIGITPNLSIAQSKLAEKNCLRKLINIWAVKKKNMALLHDLKSQNIFPCTVCRAAATSSSRSGDGNEDISDNYNNNKEPCIDDDSLVYSAVYCTDTKSMDEQISIPGSNKDIEGDNGEDACSTGYRLVNDVRPDFTRILTDVKKFAISKGEKRVAVSLCGPDTLVSDAIKCARSLSDSTVQLDLSIEQFHI